LYIPRRGFDDHLAETATVADSFGYSWQLSSRIETVAPSDMQARWDRAIGQA
jgi:hypothetical protein